MVGEKQEFEYSELAIEQLAERIVGHVGSPPLLGIDIGYYNTRINHTPVEWYRMFTSVSYEPEVFLVLNTLVYILIILTCIKVHTNIV